MVSVTWHCMRKKARVVKMTCEIRPALLRSSSLAFLLSSAGTWPLSKFIVESGSDDMPMMVSRKLDYIHTDFTHFPGLLVYSYDWSEFGSRQLAG